MTTEIKLPASLPATAVNIVRLIGFEKAMLFCSWNGFAGQVIKIPVSDRLGRGGWRERIAALVGEQEAKVLVAHYAGERLEVPTCVHALRDARDLAIQADYDDNKMSVADLVSKYRLPDRRIRIILKRVIEPSGVTVVQDDRQGVLFNEGGDSCS